MMFEGTMIDEAGTPCNLFNVVLSARFSMQTNDFLSNRVQITETNRIMQQHMYT